MTHPRLTVVEDDQSYAPQLPASAEAEQMLLAAILVNNRVHAQVSSFLAPEHFADPFYGEIYRAACHVIERGKEASPATLAPYIVDQYQNDDMPVGGYLARLAAGAVTVINAKDYGETILDLYQRRELIFALQDTLDAAYNPDMAQNALELASGAQIRLGGIGGTGMAEFASARAVRLASAARLGEDIPCTSTGIARLDTAMGGGLFEGKCYGIIARKKAGKSLLASGILHYAAGAVPEDRFLYVATEMGAEGIEQRAWAAEMRVNALKFLNNRDRANPNFIATAGERAMDALENFYYAHQPGIHFDRLKRLLNQFVMQFDRPRGFVLDYLQLVRGKERGENLVEFGDRVAQWLANFCLDRKVWGVVMAQANQEGNVRFGEGLRLACDMCFELCRTEDGDGKEAWLNMIETRYTPWMAVGSEEAPSLMLNTKEGPCYQEVPVEITEQPAELGF